MYITKMYITKIYKRLTKNVNLTNNMIINIILVALFLLLGLHWWYKQTIIEGGFFKKISKAAPKSVGKFVPKSVRKIVPKSVRKIVPKSVRKAVGKAVRKAVPISIPGSVGGLAGGAKQLCNKYCNCSRSTTGPCKVFIKHIYRTNQFMKNQCNNCFCSLKSSGCSF